MSDINAWVWTSETKEAVPASEAAVSLLDRGYLFGEALYETMRTYHSRIFALGGHLARLESGARRIGCPDLPLEEIAGALQNLASRRSPEESSLRINLSRGIAYPGYSTASVGPVRWAAYCGPLPPHVAPCYERGVTCHLSGRPRWNPCDFVPAVKFACNQELALAKLEAEKVDAFEALLLNPDGFLAEGASSTVFLVKDRRVVTPSLETGILDGLTRACILHLARRDGIPCEERKVRPEELWEAEEIFIASTLKEIIPVVRIGERVIGRGEPGLISDRLLGLYQTHAIEATREGNYPYHCSCIPKA